MKWLISSEQNSPHFAAAGGAVVVVAILLLLLVVVRERLFLHVLIMSGLRPLKFRERQPALLWRGYLKRGVGSHSSTLHERGVSSRKILGISDRVTHTIRF